MYQLRKSLDLPVERIWSKTINGGFDDVDGLHVGKFMVVIPPKLIKEYCPQLKRKYPHLPIGLKVHDFTSKAETYLTEEATIAQNIGWLLDIAPRVYERTSIKFDDEEFTAQVIEYVTGGFIELELVGERWDEYANKLSKYHIQAKKHDHYCANFVGNKLVDFDFFYFTDKKAYKKDLEKRFVELAWWGSPANSYQNLPNLGIEGSRTHERFEKLDMMEMDLTGKTVLDIGCSGGQVLYWAAERNAERIVGLDKPTIADVCFEMANYHKFFNIETVGCDLTKDDIQKTVFKKTGLIQFDIVVIFSMNHHIGFHPYMKDLCKDTLLMESNAARWDEKEWYPKQLKKIGYTQFEHRGVVNESGGRELFICH